MNTPKKQQQAGIISIMMTVVMMLVISLIVLGLAQISRREQRQSTDDQLSAQAFYAAESGVNDVKSILKTASRPVQSKDACGDDSSGPYVSLASTSQIAPGVSYSCVIITPNPEQIGGGAGTQPKVYSLVTTAPGLDNVTFTWHPGDGLNGNNVGSCPSALNNKNLFPTGQTPGGPWTCPYAVLRVDLVNAATLSRASLINATRTFFLVPGAPGSVLGANPRLLGATCTVSQCKTTIAGLLPSGRYYARVSAVYTNAKIDITGSVNSAAAKFVDHVIVDVTGKAQDVLRRIRVSVDLASGNENADGGASIMSGDTICKRFTVDRNGAKIDPQAAAAPYNCN